MGFAKVVFAAEARLKKQVEQGKIILRDIESPFGEGYDRFQIAEHLIGNFEQQSFEHLLDGGTEP